MPHGNQMPLALKLRARKQAYIENLEKRWNDCMRLGVQATVEMQKEAQRVQEENRLLRTVLRNQGFDDTSIQRALDSARLAERNIDQPQVPRFFCGIQNDPDCTPLVHDNAPAPQQPLNLPPAERPPPLDSQGDISQSLVLHNWLVDLCNIKDAFGAEVNFNDQISQDNLDFIEMPPEDPLQFTILNDPEYDLAP
ncbi:hypothetical protein K449DRAFT_454604 [Hypoxylon sp. EC38]|nr:hypothetical protein K449DRAFT_454604 [Hypoxylon sp. EC38]